MQTTPYDSPESCFLTQKYPGEIPTGSYPTGREPVTPFEFCRDFFSQKTTLRGCQVEAG